MYILRFKFHSKFQIENIFTFTEARRPSQDQDILSWYKKCQVQYVNRPHTMNMTSFGKQKQPNPY